MSTVIISHSQSGQQKKDHEDDDDGANVEVSRRQY